MGDTSSKGLLIPHRRLGRMAWAGKLNVLGEGLAAYQFVGGVMAYQDDDG